MAQNRKSPSFAAHRHVKVHEPSSIRRKTWVDHAFFCCHSPRYEHLFRILMRATTSSLVSKLRSIYSSKGRWVGTMSTRKQTNDIASEAYKENEKIEPVAALNRPPPLSPFLGPLVALSTLESRNRSDD